MYFRKLVLLRSHRLLACACALCVLLAFAATAQADLPPWLQHLVGASTGEAALYRLMHLPSTDILYPRPPREAQQELAKAVLAKPDPALYALRAQVDEQALDEPAAEADWKHYAQAANTPEARLALADFYDRRLEIAPEIPILTQVAALPALPEEAYVPASQQRSWRLFNRLLYVQAAQGVSSAQMLAAYDAFLARYPVEPAAYARALAYALEQKNYPAAEALIARYKQHVPQDVIFPIRATALLALERDGPDRALIVYDQAFQPLWPAPLVASYLALLEQTHRQRAFVAAARAALLVNPNGAPALNALARIFYYDQQAGRTPQALQTLDAFRVDREARHGAWTPEDLATLAALSTIANAPAEAARYNFALASTPGALPSGEPAAQAGLAALTHLLLSAPEQPLALGAGNLSLYRDIATLDQGPGYWNGILSLWLNGTSPASEYNAETAKAQTYFHRSKAAELLAQLDAKFPDAPQRAALHADLIAAEAQYGDPASVIASGDTFLKAFPQASQRVDVALLMADADARQNNTFAEFLLYDQLLAELAAKTAGLPLSSAAPSSPSAVADATVDATTSGASTPTVKTEDLLSLYTPVRPSLAAGEAYRQVLDRYLARLVATHQLPEALKLLRRELDRNPNDPALYERLATFLQQNNLTAGQEEVYRRAIAHFGQTTYYDKLARFYLREKRRSDYATLTRQVVDIFSGTDLDQYFRTVLVTDAPTEAGPQLALELNLYAQKRFPHDLVFTRNLLTAYQTQPTQNAAAYEALLRAHWFAADDLRNQFFALLSRTGKLDRELAALKPASTQAQAGNPAALDELAGLEMWTSHFEDAAAPLHTLAELYPADRDKDERAVSLFRSLSYSDPTPASLEQAVAIEQHLLTATPDSPDALATLGDLYAEATATGGNDAASIARAAPFWRRIPALHPGTPTGSLTSATVFWDYFQFDDALDEIRAARARFKVATLYGYEAGAIEENRGDLSAAVAEYTAVAVRPPGLHTEVQLAWATLDAFFAPPADAADSNLQSTLQAFFGTEEAQHRLLQLAARPATKALVDEASAKALTAAPTSSTALTLRVDVLVSQHRVPDLAPLLTSALAHAATEDQAAAIGALAQQHTLTTVYEQALTRQAALTPDPVGRIQLEYALVASLEARKQTAAASVVVAQVYTANPRLLSVVRNTVDFYGRTAQQPKAIATLLDAAKVSIPKLAHDFTLEAATRANDSGNAAQARALALSLLPQSPYDAQVLAVVADSYARQKDNVGLKAFYLAQLDLARAAPGLSRDDRKSDIALLRRGLIPALTRLNDHAGAIDQYTALLSAYPEDAATGDQAALYALAHGQQARLLDFLNTTVQQSPKDSRFAILLAQAQTVFANLPAALRAYDAAITIRKDRADLYQARATLELQLAQADASQLDRAADDFGHLYALTYHDPQWQVRLAEIRARQGRPDDAVAALRTAYIEGHATSGPVAAANSFTVAAQLAEWNLLTQARTFAEGGLHLAGGVLFTDSNLAPSGARTYARVLTRLGKANEALTALNAARRAELSASFSNSVLEAAFGAALQSEADSSADGTAAADGTGDNAASEDDTPQKVDAETRKQLLDQRRQAINTAFNAAVDAAGQTVKVYFTPEQKAAFATTLDTLHASDAPLALEAATSAGLASREAQWRKRELLSSAPDAANLAAYTSLQQHRLAFADLGQTLEAYAARVPAAERDGVRAQAAEAYADAGDTTAELRVSRAAALRNDTTLRDRYFDLLLSHNPAALASLAAGKDATLADAAVNYTVAHGSFVQATATLAARGKSLPAVWTPANTALAGVYLAPAGSPAVVSSFAHVLRASDTIGDRLDRPSNPKQVLTGEVWFDFASRFGLFLNLSANGSSEQQDFTAQDFLPAGLEGTSGSADSYLDLARTFAENNQITAAQTQFAHVLELEPTGDDALATYDEQALLLDRSGNHAAALAQWRAGLALLRDRQDSGDYGERFYTSFEAILAHTAVRHLNVQPEVEAVLRPYLTHNGNYRSNELLKAAYLAAPTPQAGTAMLLSLAGAGTDPDQILSDVENSAWLGPDAKHGVLARRIELARNAPASANPYSASPEQRVLTLQARLLADYLDSSDYTQAQALLDSIAPEKRSKQQSGSFAPFVGRARRTPARVARWLRGCTRNRSGTVHGELCRGRLIHATGKLCRPCACPPAARICVRS